MKLGAALTCLTLLAAHASAQTIAQLLTTNSAGGTSEGRTFSAISKTAALVSQHPEWGTPGTKTLVISVDSGFGTYNGTGFLYTDTIALNWNTAAKYIVLRDTTNDPIAVYDNYNSGFTLHFRTGTEDLVALASLQASNGFIYILPAPLKKLSPITTVLTGNANLGVGAWSNLIQNAGLTATINSLANVTFLTPNDTAITAAQSRLQALSQPQLQYLIARHILTTTLFSNGFGVAPLTNLLGETLPATSGPNAAGEFTNTIGGATLLIPNDVTSVNGPAQALNSILFPSTFPANAAFPTNIPAANLLAGASVPTTVVVTTVPRTTAASTATAAVQATGAVVTTASSSPVATTTKSSAQKVGISAFVLVSVFALFA